MGANPMQKMKRNSILTGLIIGLVIGLILCVCLYFFLTQTPGAINKSDETISVCVLNRAVKSGETITISDVIQKTMNKEDIPANAVTLTTDAVAKIELSAGTIITSSMLNTSSETLTKDLREQEYNMITLPSKLESGDFIDIRLQLPNGGDYIVISKKQVLNCNTSTIWLKMNEEELLTMSNAVIEYYIMPGSKLYAITYTEAGLQEASIPTYCPNSEVVALINGNKNITSDIIDGEGRFADAIKNIRNNTINKELNKYSDSSLTNIEQNIQEEIERLKASRESYFGALDEMY